MKTLMPSKVKILKEYKEKTPLLQKYNIDTKLEKIHSPIANLKSGGYIVINQMALPWMMKTPAENLTVRPGRQGSRHVQRRAAVRCRARHRGGRRRRGRRRVVAGGKNLRINE